MLGQRIRELRDRARIAMDELAEMSGVSVDTLAALENGTIRKITTSTLVRIADGLRLRDSDDYLNLLHINKHQLRFKAYNVGLARTGTVTVTKMFGHYRSAHEWQLFPILSTIDGYLNNVISRSEFRRIVKKRDVVMMREMDSACYNHYFLDILQNEYPSARFLFTIRDCCSWLDSVFNTLPTWLPKDSGATNPLQQTRLVFGLRDFVTWDADEFRENLTRHVDEALSFWAHHNTKILKDLPRDRSLVIRTHELGTSAGDIAQFIGVPPESLAEPERANQSATKLHLLREIDARVLKQKVEEHCSDLMQEWFPTFTFEQFLRKQEARETS